MRTVFLQGVSTIAVAAVISRGFVAVHFSGGILVSDCSLGMFVDGTSFSIGDEVERALLIEIASPLEADLALG